MGTVELAALRRRARAAGMSLGIVARAERLQVEHRASRQTGLRPPPAPRYVNSRAVEFEGVSRWIVGICKPAMARAVGEDLTAIGFRAYCPMGRRLLLHSRGPSGRRRRIQQFAIFGRYLFIGEMLESFSRHLHEGVVDVIGDSQGPLTLDPAIIKIINEQEMAGRWDFVGELTNPFKIGQSARIADGHPFEHFAGLITGLVQGGAEIEVNMFGRQTKVAVPAHKLMIV